MTVHDSDRSHMTRAIEASHEALLAGDMPFGATLVQNGSTLHVSRNNQRTQGDVTGHAEVVLLREGSARHGRASLTGATVYASGEPCAMCAGALFWAGVSRLVYAASTADIIAELGGPSLPIGTREVLSGASPSVTVEGPLLREEALAVLRHFAIRERARNE